jgi:hypothetical protein
MKKSSKRNHTCPQCHRSGFTKSGLNSHDCKPTPKAPAPIVLGKTGERKVSELTLHATLKRILMMHEVHEKLTKQRVKKPEHREAADEILEDEEAFFADLDENGIIEPLKITQDGKVADGRHRLRWASLRNKLTVPVTIVTEDEATRIIEGSVVARRHWTKGMKAYFAVLMHPEAVQAGRQKSAANLRQGPIPTESESGKHSDSVGMLTREQLAAKFGVSADLIDQACKLYERFEASKSLREAHEKLVWAGFGLGGILAGLAGAEHTPKRILPSNLTAGLFRRLTAFGGNIAQTWGKVKDEDQRQFIGESLATFLSKLPAELRTIARERLADDPEA